jgi:RNA polymerase sigma-70 factor (ECF subfamily)
MRQRFLFVGGICRLQHVSRQWFDRFVAKTRGELHGYLSRLLPLPEDRYEVSQEAYLKVFVALRRSSDKDHAPRALLYTTARNLAISRLRHNRVIEQSAQAVTVSQELCVRRRTPEHDACSSEDANFLRQVMAMLPPKRRQVMELRIVRGLSQKEIASTLGIAVSTVEKHLASGLRESQAAMLKIRRRSDQPPLDVAKVQGSRS